MAKIDNYFGDWLKVIDVKEMYRVLSILEKQYKTKPVCPLYKDIFKAFHLCPYSKLHLIILLQDPYPDIYHKVPRATGIALGNSVGTPEEELSPSLQVLKESVINYEIYHNPITFDNTLETWAKQGILLLNTALTVEMNKVGSHKALWRPFVAALLKNLSDYNPGLLYVLMGSEAQTFEPYIASCNVVMKCHHPAYYARTNTKMPYIWKEIAKMIKYNDGVDIEWFKEEKYGEQED